MIRYYCDGCGHTLDGQALLDGQRFSQENLPAFGTAIVTELFCAEKCQPHAHDYWTKKTEVFTESLKRHNDTLNNFRDRFFKDLRRGNLKKVAEK